MPFFCPVGEDTTYPFQCFFFVMIRVFLYQNLYLEVYLCIFTDIHERQRNYFFLKMIVCSISISSKILCICKGCEGDNIGLWGQKKIPHYFICKTQIYI